MHPLQPKRELPHIIFLLHFDDLSYIFKQENSLQSFHAILLHLGF